MAKAWIASALVLSALCCAAHAAYTPLFNCPLTPTVKSVASGLAGGIACSSVDADALAAGTFAVQEIDAKSSNDDGPLQLVAVLNYGTQVVAGTNRFVTVVYNNTKGAMNIVQAQVFINLQGKKTLSKSAPVPTSPLAASASNKAATTQLFECPTATKPGGLSCKAPDADAAKAAAFSLQQINAQSAFVKGPAALVSVIPPYASQVVAGRNLYVTFVTSTSDGAAAIVQSKVWYKLDGKMELTSWQVLQQAASAGTAQSAAAGAGGAAAKALFTCPTQPLLGGLSCSAPDATAKSVAAFAVSALNTKKAIPNSPVTLDDVTQYATQVVAGTNYFLQLSLKDCTGAPVNAQVKVYQPLGNSPRQLSDYVILPQGSQTGPVGSSGAAAAAPAGARGMKEGAAANATAAVAGNATAAAAAPKVGAIKPAPAKATSAAPKVGANKTGIAIAPKGTPSNATTAPKAGNATTALLAPSKTATATSNTSAATAANAGSTVPKATIATPVAPPKASLSIVPQAATPSVSAPRSMEKFDCPSQLVAGGLLCKPADEDAKAVAAYALQQINAQKLIKNTPATLVDITKYATQVVAGTNYYLELQLKDCTKKDVTVQVTVYQSLDGTKELTGFVAL